MIHLDGLYKKYSDKVALNGVDIKINDGEIFGLIGHNGAGKSTIIKSLVSIIDFDGGNIFVDNQNLREYRDVIKTKIGYVPDSPDIFLRLPVSFYWDFIAKVYQVSEEVKNNRIAEFKKIFDMNDDDYNCNIEELSHGMRQKVIIVGALISNPKIWILDEPLTGLDPQSAYNLKELMKKHAKDGNIVLFSTHILEVAESLCNRICILKKGNVLFTGTIDELKANNSIDNLESIYLKMIDEKGTQDE